MIFLTGEQRTNLVIMVGFEKASNDYRWRIGGRHVEFRQDENEVGSQSKEIFTNPSRDIINLHDEAGWASSVTAIVHGISIIMQNP
jgi:hypothetical protein